MRRGAKGGGRRERGKGGTTTSLTEKVRRIAAVTLVTVLGDRGGAFLSAWTDRHYNRVRGCVGKRERGTAERRERGGGEGGPSLPRLHGSRARHRPPAGRHGVGGRYREYKRERQLGSDDSKGMGVVVGCGRSGGKREYQQVR